MKQTKDEALADYLRARQNRKAQATDPKVAYFGTDGSYTEEAALNYFGEDRPLTAYQNAEDVFIALRDGTADYGVLPVENSTTGAIAGIYDDLARYRMVIVGETTVKIEHCLMGLPGASTSELTEVYSHAQGFAQSQPFLANYPDFKLLTYHNTAVAAAHVAAAGDPKLGAIASRRAAQIHGLEILAENINASEVNVTRFVVVAREMEICPDCRKFSIVFRLPHVAGSLYDVLGLFNERTLNLVKIESRPLPETPFEYRFFLDFIGDLPDSEIDELITQVMALTEGFHFLGNYHPAK